MTNKEKLHQILSSLWKNDDSVGKTYYNQALQDVQIAIDSLQEEKKVPKFKVGDRIKFKGIHNEDVTRVVTDIKEGEGGGSRDFFADGSIHSIGGDEIELVEEPVSEDLGEYINELSKQFPEVSFAKLSRIAVRVAKWQKEQFEKNRLKHCNSITNEQAELEQKFLDEHLDKYNRMPTFLDAIEYGMDLQKKLMMKGLCFETKVYLESDGCAEDFNESEWLDLEKTEITELPVDALGLKAGDKAMILIVKSE